MECVRGGSYISCHELGRSERLPEKNTHWSNWMQVPPLRCLRIINRRILIASLDVLSVKVLQRTCGLRTRDRHERTLRNTCFRYCFGYENKTGYVFWLFFKGLCSAISLKRSRRELSIDVAEHRSTLKITKKSITPVLVSYPKQI